MKYAIIQVSGKQYIIKPGFWYDIDFIKKLKKGNLIYLNKILLLKNNEKIQVGKPFLKNIKIIVKFIKHIKGPKMLILKTKPKKNYTRKYGFRKLYTRIKI